MNTNFGTLTTRNCVGSEVKMISLTTGLLIKCYEELIAGSVTATRLDYIRVPRWVLMASQYPQPQAPFW
jgi:hypothetical protein